MPVEDTLKQRGEVYGDYEGGSILRALIMKTIHNRYREVHGKTMPPLETVYIYDIVNTLSRLAVTPDHTDTWHDIAGYAKKDCNSWKNKCWKIKSN